MNDNITIRLVNKTTGEIKELGGYLSLKEVISFLKMYQKKGWYFTEIKRDTLNMES